MAARLKILTRRAALKVGTYDESTRTGELVFTAGADVTRRDRRGDLYIERMPTNEGAYNLTRMRSPAGLPLLIEHDPTRRAGRIQGISFTSDEGRARYKLSTNQN